MTHLPRDRPRVLGWDLLRGLCALSVMTYHFLGWQELAHLSTLGTYGVYLFFILSGASLAYVYDAQALSTPAGVVRFLLARWMRLAPLYLALCALWLPMLAAHLGHGVDRLPQRLALNASFGFGLMDPTTWALLVGGWSLGIEFVFYLALPLALQAVSRPVWRWGVLAALALGQAAWIGATVGRLGFAAAATAYHQVPAFAAYFFAGCVIGHWQRGREADLGPRAGVALWLSMALLLLALAPAQAGEELLGWRGLVLPPLCALTVWGSGRVRIAQRGVRVAAWLGDITYGAYLLHPLLFFGFTWFVLPQWHAAGVEALPVPARVAVLLSLGALTVLAATVSERCFEGPLRRSVRKPGRVIAAPEGVVAGP